MPASTSLSGLRRPQLLLALLIAVTWLSLVAFFIFGRYRLPVLPLLLAASGGGAWAIGSAWKRGGIARFVVPAIATGLAVVAFLPRGLLTKPEAIGPQAWYNLGNLHLERGRWAEAAGAYEKALAVEPSFVHAREARLGLGLALLREGRSDAALDELRALTAAHPDFGRGWHRLGNAFHQVGRAADADAAYRKACDLLPADPGPPFDMGVLRASQGAIEEARAWYAEALRRDPAFEPAREALDGLRR